MSAKFNERAWAGQIISWIKEEAAAGRTAFQDAVNDAGIKVASGRTKFPDVLLYSDKTAGQIFNGWELKWPDVRVDDEEMLLNALEKAERLKADSFVTWNAQEAVIWKIADANYTLAGLSGLKRYPKEQAIPTRQTLETPASYQKVEPLLRARLNEILHHLEQLMQDGVLRAAVSVSGNIIEAVTNAAAQFIPVTTASINDLKGSSKKFSDAFKHWTIVESSTLKILASSSQRVENVISEEVLAKFIYYKTVGKILFYLTLSENYGGKVPPLDIDPKQKTSTQLEACYAVAKDIDYQAIFEGDFTDAIMPSDASERIVAQLIGVFQEFDFKILPSAVIGYILENLVPKEEKRKFGQYFTPEILATLVTMSAIRTRNDILADPTSGTGTFLDVFYKALSFLGNTNHQALLDQIWGNDISTFPAILSVINLYKQRVDDVANFPRVTRRDFFALSPGQTIPIPDNKEAGKINEVPIPHFDAIISNFPFIQQEDIPNDVLTEHFRMQFAASQVAFMSGNKFSINERSDYYIYCFYQSLRFLRSDGMLAAITSNAWLGKDYGAQFKRFLLDNFNVKYVVRSTAEHWFQDSKVSTIYITLQRGQSAEPARFVTVTKKLDELFAGKGPQAFENFYTSLDYCTLPESKDWTQDAQYPEAYRKKDGAARVVHIGRAALRASLGSGRNWASFFIAVDIFAPFADKLINPFPQYYATGRGTRTGWDAMHIISTEDNEHLQIEDQFLWPILKSNTEISAIHHTAATTYNLFVCDQPEDELRKHAPNAWRHIQSFEAATNKIGRPLPEVLGHRRPYWYTLSSEDAGSIFISISPNKRLFFSFTSEPYFANQRLAVIRTAPENTEIIAALLNSVVTLLRLELTGTSRNLGALDLNATYLKTTIGMFDPALLSPEEKAAILEAFRPLSQRPMFDYDAEYQQPDRKAFDRTVLSAFGYDAAALLPKLYEVLTNAIHDRVSLKDR